MALLLLIVLGYGLTAEFPIFFSQKRIGRKNKQFTLWKFRTLSPDQNKPLHLREFVWGNFLRQSNLDELPQLWNVLKGEMSFVGPRPLPVEYSTFFSEEQKRRHDVLPGITGWAQVSGKNDISWQQKFERDLYYVNNISFLLDLKILLKTFILVLSFKKDTSLHEKKFTE
ncbi:MAG: sugar transferase [Cyclobacteriaceae bacterium]|nr:sugar transferase [Cyclobacteriaceae bacterium]